MRAAVSLAPRSAAGRPVAVARAQSSAAARPTTEAQWSLEATAQHGTAFGRHTCSFKRLQQHADARQQHSARRRRAVLKAASSNTAWPQVVLLVASTRAKVSPLHQRTAIRSLTRTGHAIPPHLYPGSCVLCCRITSSLVNEEASLQRTHAFLHSAQRLGAARDLGRRAVGP